MQIYERNIEHRLNGFVSSVFKLDKSYMLKDFGPETKELLGGYNALAFDEIGFTDDDKTDISDFLETVRKTGCHRAIVTINDRDNKPRVVDIRGTYHDELEYPYEINMWDIENAELDYCYYNEVTWKYRAMIGMTGLTFFDYDAKENIVSFYRYVTKKSIRMFYGTMEQFEEELYRTSDTGDSNQNAIKKFVEQLRGCDNSVETIISTGILNKNNKLQKLHMKAQYDDMDGHKRMYGVASNISITSDDVPFYMTPAGIDSMTGLLNKRSIVEYSQDVLTNAATAARTHYMILIDIDDFKMINDSYGHQVGDNAIMMLSRVLMDVVKDDGLIGRYGGDEFYILTDRVPDESALRTLLRTIKTTTTMRGKDELGIEGITLSMGISKSPDNGVSYKDLLFLADKALYIAKEKGKNRYVIYRYAMHENVNVGVNRSGISSYDEQSKVINKVIKELFVRGKDSIEEHLSEIVKGFDLDSIDIFYGPKLERLYSVGKYSSGFECERFIENKKYMGCFDDNGLYVLNNCHNLRQPIPQLHSYLIEKGCMSLIQMALPTPEAPEYFISFNILNRNHKWSDAEISNLGLYGSLVFEMLVRK